MIKIRLRVLTRHRRRAAFDVRRLTFTPRDTTTPVEPHLQICVVQIHADTHAMHKSTFSVLCSAIQCCNYLRQVNEVNGGDNAFVRCVSVSVCVCVCAAAGHGS